MQSALFLKCFEWRFLHYLTAIVGNWYWNVTSKWEVLFFIELRFFSELFFWVAKDTPFANRPILYPGSESSEFVSASCPRLVVVPFRVLDIYSRCSRLDRWGSTPPLISNRFQSV